MSLFERIRIVIREEDAKDPKKSKAQNYSDKINKKNKNRKEFKFDPKTKERQTFKGKITSGPQKGQGYTIFRRDGGDVKKGVDKGVLPKAAKGDPIDVKSPAHKDLFKRYAKGEPKATQFMIDLGKDDRKARGLGKRAERVAGASGGKTTGSLSKGNLSFPGDRTGAYSATKSQIEFNKALKKARGNTEGDLPKETPQSVRDYAKKVRDKRIKKLKLPDTSFDSKTKFSQKRFEKSLKKFSKGPRTGIVNPFGKGITKGQANVKGLEAKAFKKTQPRDIKLPQSFTDFSKKLRRLKSDVQDFKDRNLPGGPRKTSRTSFKGQGSGSRFDPGIGMAPPDTPKKTKPQKSVSAIETTKKYKQEKNLKTFEKFRKEAGKEAETATKNLRKKVDTIAKNPKLTGSQKAAQSRPVMKDVKTAQNFARGYANPKTAQTAITVPKDIKTVQSAAKTPKPKSKTGSQIMKQNEIVRIGSTGKVKTTGPVYLDDIPVKNVPREIRFGQTSSKVLKKTPKAIKPIARPALKLLAKAGTPGRIAALGLGAAAISPAGRKALGQLATGTGLTALFGRGKKEKQLKVGDGLKNVGKVRVTADSKGLKRNQADMAKIKATQKNFIDKYNKGRAFGKIKYNVNKQGTYDVIKPKKK